MELLLGETMADPVLCERIVGSMTLIGGPVRVDRLIDLKGALGLDMLETENAHYWVSNTQFKKAVGSLIDRDVLGQTRRPGYSMVDDASVTVWLRTSPSFTV